MEAHAVILLVPVNSSLPLSVRVVRCGGLMANCVGVCVCICVVCACAEDEADAAEAAEEEEEEDEKKEEGTMGEEANGFNGSYA